MNKLFKIILNYFLRGVLFLVPVAATIYVIVQTFLYIDGLIPINVPGLGLLTLLATITIFGMLASTVLAQPFVYWGNQLLNSAPLVKTIYSSVKDLLSAFVGQEKRFDQPELGIPSGKVAVYLPHSYAFSGNLFIVPAESITLIDAKAADVMKFIVSGGVTKIGEQPES
jgi:uncharacterized membrane protein